MRETTLIETAQQMLRAGMSLAEGTRELRRQMIEETLREHKGNVCHAATALRVHRNTLNRQVHELKLEDVARSLRANRREKQSALKFSRRLPANCPPANFAAPRLSRVA
jgi:hypothetical protein